MFSDRTITLRLNKEHCTISYWSRLRNLIINCPKKWKKDRRNECLMNKIWYVPRLLCQVQPAGRNFSCDKSDRLDTTEPRCGLRLQLTRPIKGDLHQLRARAKRMSHHWDLMDLFAPTLRRENLVALTSSRRDSDTLHGYRFGKRLLLFPDFSQFYPEKIARGAIRRRRIREIFARQKMRKCLAI
jgi:hypothetical protein